MPPTRPAALPNSSAAQASGSLPSASAKPCVRYAETTRSWAAIACCVATAIASWPM